MASPHGASDAFSLSFGVTFSDLPTSATRRKMGDRVLGSGHLPVPFGQTFLESTLQLSGVVMKRKLVL